jgi:hypothetical protein
MGLSVRALCEAERIPPQQDVTAWTSDDVLREFELVQDRLTRLTHSPELRALEDSRQRSLRDASVHPDAMTSIELLERLASLTANVKVVEDELSDAKFVEEEDPTARASFRTAKLWRRFGPVRSGLRPRPGFIDVPTTGLVEGLVRRARTQVASFRDSLEILEHQVGAASRSGDEAFTCLVEPIGMDVHEAIARVVLALPRAFGRSRAHTERVDAVTGKTRWVEVSPHEIHSIIRRTCVTLQGAGLRPMLEPLAGFAFVRTVDAQGPRPTLVRITVLEGGDGLERVREHDEAMANARRARRDGLVEPDDAPGLVTMRDESDGVRFSHLATGLAATAVEAVLAALLRARRGEHGTADSVTTLEAP